jgi:hypothetical protein
MPSGTSRAIRRALLLGALGVACVEAQPAVPSRVATTTSQATMSAEIGREFELRNTESAAIGTEGLTLRFNRVTTDDRCSVGSRCESDGDAVVEVTLRPPSSDAAILELHTDPARRTEARYLRYAVRLVRLEPRPVGEQPVPLPQYTATFIVSVHSNPSLEEGIP